MKLNHHFHTLSLTDSRKEKLEVKQDESLLHTDSVPQGRKVKDKRGNNKT
jgi:hypothetical protein